jgi:hypothetical protein
MPSFTQELSCTDGSTDASIFSPSVHPTLHWSVAPTCHICRRLPLFVSNHNLPSAAGCARRCLPARLRRPPRVARALRLLLRSSAVVRARRRPPAPPTLANSAHAQDTALIVGFGRVAILRPCAAVPARQRPQGGAQGSIPLPQPHLLDTFTLW